MWMKNTAIFTAVEHLTGMDVNQVIAIVHQVRADEHVVVLGPFEHANCSTTMTTRRHVGATRKVARHSVLPMHLGRAAQRRNSAPNRPGGRRMTEMLNAGMEDAKRRHGDPLCWTEIDCVQRSGFTRSRRSSRAVLIEG